MSMSEQFQGAKANCRQPHRRSAAGSREEIFETRSWHGRQGITLSASRHAYLHKKGSFRPRVMRKLQHANISLLAEVTQPAWVRICHWGFAASMTLLLLTGFELHQPATFLALMYSKVYIAHMTAAWLACAFVALRLADSFLRRDTSLRIRLRDFRDFPRLLAYYLFLRETPPPAGKYNSGQRIMFFSWFIAFLIGTLLGFVSYFQGEHLVWVLRILHGWQGVRWVKYIVALYFTATIPVHVYLSFTENVSRLQAMVSGGERRGN